MYVSRCMYVCDRVQTSHCLLPHALLCSVPLLPLLPLILLLGDVHVALQVWDIGGQSIGSKVIRGISGIRGIRGISSVRVIRVIKLIRSEPCSMQQRIFLYYLLPSNQVIFN